MNKSGGLEATTKQLVDNANVLLLLRGHSSLIACYFFSLSVQQVRKKSSKTLANKRRRSNHAKSCKLACDHRITTSLFTHVLALFKYPSLFEWQLTILYSDL